MGESEALGSSKGNKIPTDNSTYDQKNTDVTRIAYSDLQSFGLEGGVRLATLARSTRSRACAHVDCKLRTTTRVALAITIHGLLLY